MNLVEKLGANARKRRVALGLSQEEVAFRAGMKRSYLSDLERGVRNPTVRALGRLATALEAEPWELLAPERDDQDHGV